MSETECRHLPRPVWNPARCAKCGATLEQPSDARLVRAARFFASWCPGFGDEYDRKAAAHRAVIAEAERGGLTWTTERPTVPGLHLAFSGRRITGVEWDAVTAAMDWTGYLWYAGGPIAPPPCPAGGETGAGPE